MQIPLIVNLQQMNKFNEQSRKYKILLIRCVFPFHQHFSSAISEILESRLKPTREQIMENALFART